MNVESGTALCVERTGRSVALGKGSLQMLRAEFQTPSQKSPRWKVQSREPERHSTELSPTLSAKRQTPDFHLVGRDAELAQLHKGFNTALSGERQVIFVSGEAGIGKTTLIDVFLEQIRNRADVRITSGQCVEQYGPGEAYLPLLEATTRLCRGPGGERRIAALQRYAPSWLAQLPSLLEPQEFERLQQHRQGTSHERMLRELAETAEGFASIRTVVLVLEDLHWSDVSTLDWITYMARRRGLARLLILCAYRPTDVLASNHPLCGVVQELQAQGQCGALRLAPLVEEAIAEYLTVRLNINKEGRRAVSRQLSPLLHQRTGGNPSFLVNTVNDLIRRGVFAAEAGQQTFRADAVEVMRNVLPNTVRQLIEQQFERLPKSEQQLLEVASVAGVEFTAAEAAAGLLTEQDNIETTCERLARTGQWVQAAGVAEWPDGTISGRYRFLHAVSHEVVSTRLAEARRVHVYRRIAARKETAYSERPKESAAELTAPAIAALASLPESKPLCRLARGTIMWGGTLAEQGKQQEEGQQVVAKALQLGATTKEYVSATEQYHLKDELTWQQNRERATANGQQGKVTDFQSPILKAQDSALRTPRSSSPVSSPQPPVLGLFHCEGEYWTLSFAGSICRLKEARGFHYLAYLLQHPYQEFHVLTLTSACANPSQETMEPQSLPDLSLSFARREGLSDAGEILDPQARATYQQRLRELREELAEAQAVHDLGRSEYLTAEIDFLTRELARAVGLGGRVRRAGAPEERARVNITRAIKIAMCKITEHHPVLGQHLAMTIKTGAYCSYTPDTRLPITWQI